MSMSDKIAVLSRGVVEQYDCPEVTYSAPKTEFVARFVGSSNWIDDNRLFRPELANLKPAPAGLADKLAEGFIAATGIEVEQFQGATGEILARLEADGAPVSEGQ